MAKEKNIFIAGGYGLYKEAIPLVDVMFITEVDIEIEKTSEKQKHATQSMFRAI